MTSGAGSVGTGGERRSAGAAHGADARVSGRTGPSCSARASGCSTACISWVATSCRASSGDGRLSRRGARARGRIRHRRALARGARRRPRARRRGAHPGQRLHGRGRGAASTSASRPIPVDIRLDDLGPDLDDLAGAHHAEDARHHGRPPLRASRSTSRRSSRWPATATCSVIEDCSHAHGARSTAAASARSASPGAFSLGVVKNLAAYGDAGMVATDDGDARRAREAPRHARPGEEERARHSTAATAGSTSCRPAMLRVKLRDLDARNARRAAIAAHYTRAARAAASCRRRAIRAARTSITST